MIAKTLAGFILTVLLLTPIGAPAAGTPPDALVKNVTEQVLSILRHDPGIRAGDRERAVSVIETRVAPHFDFVRMTSLAVGRAWRQADAQQRQKLTAEFRTLLVRTYANALLAYRNQTVSFKPSPQRPQGAEATVRAEIDKPGAQPISLDYSLARSGGDWKVFDVAIDDVSLVTNYRGEFADEVAKGGVDALVRALEAKNRQFKAGAPAPSA
jgi:phospholipid transport system substrate-binding protein